MRDADSDQTGVQVQLHMVSGSSMSPAYAPIRLLFHSVSLCSLTEALPPPRCLLRGSDAGVGVEVRSI